jgi:hypothetical protein
MTALQQEAYSFINGLSESRLEVFMRFIREFAKEYKEEDYWEMKIETDLTEQEHVLCEETRREAIEHPENFISLDSLIQKYSSATQ